jgi:Domain of unknown function (DUF4145)
LFNKEIWGGLSEVTSVGNHPQIPCPYCDSNNLSIDKSSLTFRKLSGAALKTYLNKLTTNNLNNVKEEDNNWIKFFAGLTDVADMMMHEPSQFIAFFKCSMCSESVSSTGIAKLPRKDSKGIVQIKVEYFNPPIPIFPLSSITPKNINEELLASFNLFHTDICSAGNRLRRAIEKLCIELGFNVGNLHRNIEAMASDYPEESKWLDSLKLVGNEATHSDGVNESDLLDSFQVFEVVLDVFRRKEIKENTLKAVAKIDKKFKKIKN